MALLGKIDSVWVSLLALSKTEHSNYPSDGEIHILFLTQADDSLLFLFTVYPQSINSNFPHSLQTSFPCPSAFNAMLFALGHQPHLHLHTLIGTYWSQPRYLLPSDQSISKIPLSSLSPPPSLLICTLSPQLIVSLPISASLKQALQSV